jgi:GT2 family glycosyltransferase
VSVIVVTYNSREYLESLIPKILGIRYSSMEVIVVDNDSSDGSLGLLRGYTPRILLIENPRNVGWGRACNQAISIAHGEYVWLINTDLDFQEGVLESLVGFMETRPHVAVCTPLVRDFDKRDLVQSAGLSIDRWGRVRLRFIGCTVVPGTPREVTAASGSAMFLRREVLQAVGHFDESIFMYGEDLDLCIRCRLAGHSVMLNPNAVVYHRGGGTSQRHLDPLFMEAMIYRHLIRVYLKDLQSRSWLPAFVGVLAEQVARAAQYARRGRKSAFGHLVVHPFVWNLRNLDSLAVNRRAVQDTRKVTDQEAVFLA